MHSEATCAETRRAWLSLPGAGPSEATPLCDASTARDFSSEAVFSSGLTGLPDCQRAGLSSAELVRIALDVVASSIDPKAR